MSTTDNAPNLVLTGFMATGKSAVGRACARRLGRPFVDLDAEIEARARAPIPRIFEERGEAAFRDLESAVAAAVSARRGLVIATGGGTMLRESNRVALSDGGVVICLWADPATIARRVAGTGHRPLLGGAAAPGEAELAASAEALLDRRRPIYELFPNRVDTAGLTVDEVVDRVLVLFAGARSAGPDAR